MGSKLLIIHNFRLNLRFREVPSRASSPGRAKHIHYHPLWSQGHQTYPCSDPGMSCLAPLAPEAAPVARPWDSPTIYCAGRMLMQRHRMMNGRRGCTTPGGVADGDGLRSMAGAGPARHPRGRRFAPPPTPPGIHSGPQRSTAVRNGPQWSAAVRNGPQRSTAVRSGPQRSGNGPAAVHSGP